MYLHMCLHSIILGSRKANYIIGDKNAMLKVVWICKDARNFKSFICDQEYLNFIMSFMRLLYFKHSSRLHS